MGWHNACAVQGATPKQGETMKQKRHSTAAVLFGANLILCANAVLAQSSAPGVPDPRLELLQQTQTNPRQPARDGSQQEMSISPDDIRRAQEALKAKGLDPGEISGRMHTKTQEALRRFQKVNDLSTTGVLNQQTAHKLGIKLKGDNNSTPQQRQETTKPNAPTGLQLR
jgi:peptidoglycan hydrolase-like protein with peptidoglycan-binding domain